ncbi:hypothetical protein OROGR_011983 [Orobanche gracilis]
MFEVQQIDGDWRYDSRKSVLEWSIILIDNDNCMLSTFCNPPKFSQRTLMSSENYQSFPRVPSCLIIASLLHIVVTGLMQSTKVFPENTSVLQKLPSRLIIASLIHIVVTGSISTPPNLV